MQTIFKAFSCSGDYVSSLSREVNEFIDSCERLGYTVVSHSEHLRGSGDNSLIKPTFVVTVWMER